MSCEIEELYDQIYRYCFYRLRNSASAEDITQEAFLKVLAQNTEINAAYIFTIAKNLCNASCYNKYKLNFYIIFLI